MNTFLREYKIVILGNERVGKTALTEDSYRKQIYVDSIPLLLDILDTAGQEGYTQMRNQYIKEGEGFILVYSVSDPYSFRCIPHLIHSIRRNPSKAHAPIVIIANKNDLTLEKYISTQQGVQMAQEYNCTFIETSALDGIHVQKAFYTLAKQVILFL